MRKYAALTVFLTLLFTLWGCKGVNYDEAMKEPEKKFYAGNYKAAANMLKPAATKGGKDQLLLMMEAGYMFHAGGEYELSNHILLKAAKLAKVVPISISKQAAALLTNQRGTNYRGEDFEKVLVHMFLGINFLMLKKYDDARVEFKLVNEQLTKIKNEKGKARYKQNLMAKYMSAIAFEIIGDKEKDMNDLEWAYKECEQINALNPKLELVQTDLQRLSRKLKYMDDYAKWQRRFGKKDNIPGNAGELIYIFQGGKAPVKKSRGGLLKDAKMKGAIMISLNTTTLAAGVTIVAVLATMKAAENPIPYYAKRSNSTKRVRLRINNRPYYTTVMEDIENTAINNLSDDYSRLRGEVAKSVVVKAAASIAAGIIAQKIAKEAGAGAASGLIGFMAGAGTGAALFSSMAPDLRCWHTLPAKLQISRIFLKPGKYNVSMELLGNGNVVQQKKTFPVEIFKGERLFITTRTLQ